ncbi:MAG: TrkH family potassium uptake protein [Succinivibrionaceae bacterium]|nr:TrkH family potassium uptake protein [Succinivibrionaceae bacterium]
MVINLRFVARLLSACVLGFGAIATIPGIYAGLAAKEGMIEFTTTAALSVAVAWALHLIGRGARGNFSIRELFLFTASLWATTTAIAAVPFLFLIPNIGITGAIFESASGLSTTGATVINHLDQRPESILLWRSILQYIGGIGFVVIAAVVLPTAALGGMNIFKTESTSSLDGSTKITPHMRIMALSFVIWYLMMLILCSGCYIIEDLNPFLAINAALCTVSTGGMMPIDASMNGLPRAVHYTACVFMFLGSCPFMLVVGAATGNFRALFRDQQVRGLIFLITAITCLVALSLYWHNGYSGEHAIRVALFNVMAILSSTGFNLEDFTQWNSFATLIFFVILAIGGCSGSTAGGIKLFRLQICFSMFKTQIFRSIHPHGVREPRFNDRVINSDTLRAVITYLVAYVLATLLSTTVATLLGLDLADAFSASMTCLSNIGPAMGPTLSPSLNFAALNPGLTALFSFDMILGRLEILPVVLIMTRMFWR